MALETATYISDLNTSYPLSTDSVSQADDHLRLIKAALKATFPNVTGPTTATHTQMNAFVPSGGIIMWSGSIATIPSGWYLCDGLNGTPNLRDRFVVGAGTSYAVGATGGADTVALTQAQMPAHTHTITATTAADGAHTHGVNDPGHSHAYTVFGGGTTGSLYYTPQTQSSYTTNTSGAYTGITIASGGSHTHTITASASSTGSGTAHENRPPYYALAYIMKA